MIADIQPRSLHRGTGALTFKHLMEEDCGGTVIGVPANAFTLNIKSTMEIR